MEDASRLDIVVVSAAQDGLNTVENLLAGAPWPTRCQWVADAESLPESVPSPPPRVIVVLDPDQLDAGAAWRDQHVPGAAVLAVVDRVDDPIIEQTLASGAQDALSLSAPDRFRAVVTREARLAMLEASLDDARAEVDDCRRRMEHLATESQRAFLWAQEGIIANLNHACATLLEHEDVGDLVGLPVMDVFEPDGHRDLKGALVACRKGDWPAERLFCRVRTAPGGGLAVAATLEPDLFEGDNAVRLELTPVPVRPACGTAEAEGETPAAGTAADALSLEPQVGAPTRNGTGPSLVAEVDPFAIFHHRQRFLDRLVDALNVTPGGVHALYHLRIDKLNALAQRWGPLGVETILRTVADDLGARLPSGDLWGLLAGGSFCVLGDRVDHDAVQSFGEELVERVSALAPVLSGEALQLRACVGGALRAPSDDLGSLTARAARASRQAQETPGAGFLLDDPRNANLEETQDDRRHVKRIQRALRQNGFRLAFQPIADLQDRPGAMYDVLLRLLDTGDRELLPGVFLPAAERNGLMKAVDRWVIARAVESARQQDGTRLFVRVSRDSIPDGSLLDWLARQLDRAGVTPRRLVLQVTESNAVDNLRATGDLAQAARRIGCGFAVEHFGLAPEPRLLLDTLALDFVKIDGSLMAGFSDNQEHQRRVQALVDDARTRHVPTIAERVEDASTMAMLWSLGVEYIQGYYVQGHDMQDGPPALAGAGDA